MKLYHKINYLRREKVKTPKEEALSHKNYTRREMRTNR
jgi:hypothetical protein